MKTTYQIIIITAFFLIGNFFLCQDTWAQKKKTSNKKEVAKEEEEEDEWNDMPICKVMIVDSIVVDKYEIIQHISLPQHVGKLFVAKETGNIVYENEFADMRYYSAKDTSGYSNIYRQTLLAGKWSEPEALKINGSEYDYTNPFVMPDGQTLFFAARNIEDNEGKTLSLYTTTYDNETNSYLEPQRLPYPFISDCDEIMYIEDEANSVAWFVSTRRQAEKQACIYTIEVKHPWEYYDNTAYDSEQLKRLAQIEQISDTWTSAEQREAILNKLKLSKEEYVEETPNKKQMHFVISNTKTYTSLNDFKDSNSKELYIKLVDEQTKHTAYKRQLNEYRKMYHKSSFESKQRLKDVIQETEVSLKKSTEVINNLKKQIRKTEQ